MTDLIFYFLFSLCFLNWENISVGIRYLWFFKSKKQIEKWIKSQEWFLDYYRLHVYKNERIMIFITYKGQELKINHWNITSLENWLGCKKLTILAEDNEQILMKVEWL